MLSLPMLLDLPPSFYFVHRPTSSGLEASELKANKERLGKDATTT